MTNPSNLQMSDFDELVNAAYRVGVSETLLQFMHVQSLDDVKHIMLTIVRHPEFERMQVRGLSTLLGKPT